MPSPFRHPSAAFVEQVIEQELGEVKRQQISEWQYKANNLNEAMDRAEHLRREKLIYDAETDIWGFIYQRCVKENYPFPYKCQELFDIFTERRAYILSDYNDGTKKPLLSPPLLVDYARMPYSNREPEDKELFDYWL